MKTRSLTVLLLVLTTILFGLPAAAEESFKWESYDVAIDVRSDESIRVTETMRVSFSGTFSVGYANIPMDNIAAIHNVFVTVTGQSGKSTESELVGRDEFSGEPGTHTVYREVGQTMIDYGLGPIEGHDILTIEIEYDAYGVIRDYPGDIPPLQEINWIAISNEVTATAPIDQASVTMNFPESIEGSEETHFYPEESSSTATSVTWERSGLKEGDSLQVVVSFPSMNFEATPESQNGHAP